MATLTATLLAASTPICAANKPLRIGVPELEPWVLPATGKSRGVMPRLLDYLARKTGIAIETIAAPANRLVADVNSAKIDGCLLGVGQFAAEPEGPVDFGEIFASPLVMAARPGKAFANTQELTGRLVATNQGSHIDPYAQQYGFRRYSVANLQSAVKMLNEGRVDGVFGLSPAILWALHAQEMPRSAIGSFLPLGLFSIHLWIRQSALPQSAVSRSDLIRAIDEMHSDLVVEAILADYMPRPD